MALVGVVPDAPDAVEERGGRDASSWCSELPEDATVMLLVVVVVDRRKNSNSFRSAFGGWASAHFEPLAYGRRCIRPIPWLNLLFLGVGT